METVRQENTVISWFVWHFYEMPVFLFLVWKNYLFFGLDFFSAPLLLATLFAPWKKYHFGYPKAFDVVAFLNTLCSNLFSRIIGAIIRIVLIVFGAIAQVCIFVIGMAAIIFWIAIPFIIFLLIAFAIN